MAKKAMACESGAYCPHKQRRNEKNKIIVKSKGYSAPD
jgi:hypothetical protein